MPITAPPFTEIIYFYERIGVLKTEYSNHYTTLPVSGNLHNLMLILENDVLTNTDMKRRLTSIAGRMNHCVLVSKTNVLY